MIPDRELDAIIDQKLFGVSRFIGDNQLNLGIGVDECPFYCNKIQDCWKVVEQLHILGYLVTVEQAFHEGFEGIVYQCTLMAYSIQRISENMNRGLIMGIAQSAPQAVCSAALKAIEINASAIRNMQEEAQRVQNATKKA